MITITKNDNNNLANSVLKGSPTAFKYVMYTVRCLEFPRLHTHFFSQNLLSGKNCIISSRRVIQIHSLQHQKYHPFKKTKCECIYCTVGLLHAVKHSLSLSHHYNNPYWQCLMSSDRTDNRMLVTVIEFLTKTEVSSVHII